MTYLLTYVIYFICSIPSKTVCNLDKRILQSLDFTVNRFFIKLLRTSDIEIVHYCQTVFGCELPSVGLLLVTKYEKFIKKLTRASV